MNFAATAVIQAEVRKQRNSFEAQGQCVINNIFFMNPSLFASNLPDTSSPSGIAQEAGVRTPLQAGLLLCFPTGRRWVPLTAVVLLEGIGNYTRIHFRCNPPLLVALTIKALTDRLPAGAVARLHRKYSLNWQHVQSIDWYKNEVTMVNGEQLPIARRRITEFRVEYKHYCSKINVAPAALA